jgi:hypothetical protein
MCFLVCLKGLMRFQAFGKLTKWFGSLTQGRGITTGRLGISTQGFGINTATFGKPTERRGSCHVLKYGYGLKIYLSCIFIDHIRGLIP